MIYPLILKYSYNPGYWKASIEVPDDINLVQLHDFIQDVIKFNDNHFYTYYLAKSQHTQNRTLLTPFSFEPNNDVKILSKISIKNIYDKLTARKLYYWFDFTADWIFEITKGRKQPFEVVNTSCYPKLIKEIGTRQKPKQYFE